jgi:hypothetical protein
MQQDLAGFGQPGLPSIKVSKRFFLNKEAKTFANVALRQPHRKPLIAKVFWFFFSKKNAYFLCLEGLGAPFIMPG